MTLHRAAIPTASYFDKGEVTFMQTLTSPPPAASLNLEDLELLHHYVMYTCIATSQLPEMTTYKQKIVPELAQENPFAMYGILAMAATHLSRLRPQQHMHYSILAASRHQAAIPSFRSALQKIDEKNFQALISYSKSLVWCSFAEDEASLQQAQSEDRGKDEVSGNWLPRWFKLLHGSCQIVAASRSWIHEGPHVLQSLQDLSTQECSGQAFVDCDRIDGLVGRLLPRIRRADSMAFRTVVSNLRESFVRASFHGHNTPLRNAMNFWVGHLPEEYQLLLQKKESWSLVILAHFCILVHRSETVWFMEGHAVRLLRRIHSLLESDWGEFIGWPCQELGFDPIEEI